MSEGSAETLAAVAVVALGCNVGHRGRTLARLRELLQEDGVALERCSAEILTRPVGVSGQADYHNQLLRLRAPAPWTPERWRQHCQRAEQAAGRRVTHHWGPRRADVDILLLGEHGEVRVDSESLTVPHPRIAERAFVQRLLPEVT